MEESNDNIRSILERLFQGLVLLFFLFIGLFVYSMFAVCYSRHLDKHTEDQSIWDSGACKTLNAEAYLRLRCAGMEERLDSAYARRQVLQCVGEGVNPFSSWKSTFATLVFSLMAIWLSQIWQKNRSNRVKFALQKQLLAKLDSRKMKLDSDPRLLALGNADRSPTR